MTLIRLASLFCLVPMLGVAGNWTGALVDSKCYASAQGNTNPHGAHPASTDTRGTIRRCSPKTKTQVFALVLRDGSVLNVDPAGNQKAIEMLSAAGKKTMYVVDVTGEVSEDKLRLDAINIAK